jgi:hypothetical protein
LKLSAIGPDLSFVNGQKALAKAIKGFSATEYAFGPRTKRGDNQVIPQGIEEDNYANHWMREM